MKHKTVHNMVYDLMNDKQRKAYAEFLETDFSFELPGHARFHVNAFNQRGSADMVLRVINTEIPDFDQLGLPKVLKDVVMTKCGLAIFVGGTGSGKSTLLAAMIGYRNQTSYGHIITIEDPIEFVHSHRSYVVTQREVGVDTESYEVALKDTLHQAPDVILIGEICDREITQHAIAFAETGHLCLSTSYANSTNQVLDRIINFVPDERRPQLLMDLSLNSKAVISQRLVMGLDGRRVPAVEVLISTPYISELIRTGKCGEIKEAME
jgi:twitching motility protein PilU